MKALFLFLVAALPAALQAQHLVINDANAEKRTATGFHAIKVSTGIELILTQAGEEAVAVSAPDPEMRSHIKTEVNDGVLNIYVETRWWRSFKYMDLRAYVSCKTIDKFIASSGSRTRVDGRLTANGLEMLLSSGARFTGSVQAGSVLCRQSSGAKLYLGGQAQSLTIQASSGGCFYGYDIMAANCEAVASSGGKIEITVTGELAAKASSGGKIDYRGGGVIRRLSTGSGGSVRKS